MGNKIKTTFVGPGREDENLFDEEVQILDFQKREEAKKSTGHNSQSKYTLTSPNGYQYTTEDFLKVNELLNDLDISQVIVEEANEEGATKKTFKINKGKQYKSFLAEEDDIPRGHGEVPSNLIIEEMLNGKSAKKISQRASNMFVPNISPPQGYTEAQFMKKMILSKENGINKNFFKVKDHSKLFKLGKSFLEDFENGKNTFAFSSVGDKVTMAKTLFGLCAFFNYYANRQVLMFVSDEEAEQLKKMMIFKKERTIEDNSLDIEFTVLEAEGFSIITYDSLFLVERSIIHDLLDKLSNLAGVVFCTIPNVDKFEKDIDLYFQVLQLVDSLSFIVKEEKTRLPEIRNLVNHFKNYRVFIKGVLIEQSNED